jgi:hypothetical protein
MAAQQVLPAPPAKKNRHPYWYSGQQVLAASAGAGVQGADSPFQININNHNFDAVTLMMTSTGPFLCQIQINGRNFMSAPVHSANMFGTGQLPFQLAVPISIPKGGVIQVDMYDYSGAANTVNWSLHGYEYD